MVTYHEFGEISHNKEEYYDERRVVETPPGLAKTIRSIMEELQSCKAENERLIKEQEKQTEINGVLLQILSDIQRQLQHGPTASNVDEHDTKKNQCPPDIQKHGFENRNTRRFTSKKARHRTKKKANIRSSPKVSYNEETDNSKEFSSSETSSPFHGRINRRKQAKSHGLESLRNSSHPLLMGGLRRGKK
jgi:hypothetical protein